MVLNLWLYGLEIRLLHVHMYVCETITFVYDTYIIVSNQVTEEKNIMHIGLANLCTVVTTDGNIQN